MAMASPPAGPGDTLQRERVAIEGMLRRAGLVRLTKVQLHSLFAHIAGRPMPETDILFPEVTETNAISLERMMDVIFSRPSLEVGRALLGEWVNLHSGFTYQVREAEGALYYIQAGVQAPLRREGAWLVAESAEPRVRLRAAPSGRSVTYQQRAAGAEEWSKPIFGAHPAGLAEGTELVTTAAAALMRSVEDRDPVGEAPPGTRLLAAGPPRTVGGLRLVPLQPHGHAVLAAHVRVLEDGVEEEARFPCANPCSLLDALAGGDTVLLRGSWLREQGERGAVLPRRQDLPPEAVWRPAELGPLLRGRRVQVVAVSHCWLTPEHPDPQGAQLRTLGRAMAMRLEERTMPVQDLAVFFDWCSLYQEPRLPDQTAAFERSLGSVHLWYAHAATTVLTLKTALPAECVQYGRRGWPFFERSLAGMLKDNSIDLDKPGSPADWLALAQDCAQARRPPVTPGAFAALLAHKRFTVEADRAFVVAKYRESYAQVLGHAAALDFASLGWGEQDAKVLADALPDCTALERLVLRANPLGAAGAAALAAKLPQCPHLQELWLEHTAIGDGGVSAVAAALPRCQRLRTLQLQGAGIGAEGIARLSEVIPLAPRLEAVGLAANVIGQQGVQALLAMLPACRGTPLRVLHLQKSEVEQGDQQRLLDAWKAAGKDPAQLYF